MTNDICGFILIEQFSKVHYWATQRIVEQLQKTWVIKEKSKVVAVKELIWTVGLTQAWWCCGRGTAA